MSEEANLLWQQALALYKEKKYGDSLAILENLEKLSPQEKNILFQKALCLAALRRFEEAGMLCAQLKGQFPDSRVEDLEQWIGQSAPSYHPRRFEELKAETTPTPTPAAAESQNQTRAMPPIGEALKAAALGKMFCPQCRYENDTSNYRCSRCGSLLRPSGQPSPSASFAPFAPSDLLSKLEKRANLSFLFALLGWLASLMILVMALILGPKNPSDVESNTLLGAVAIFLFIASIVLCVLAVIFGIMGMKKENRVNRWKGIVGFVMGLLGILSIGCCFILVLFVAAAQLGGTTLQPGGD